MPRLYCNDRLKDVASINTADLLVKLGFVNHQKAGLVHFLPLGLNVLQKLSGTISARMDEIDFDKLSLSLLSHSSLWEKSGRFDGKELFKLEKEDLLLVPTAEEEITNYVAGNIISYKSLPLLYYQINHKFRNEKRPRGGLLRGKEFIMKDGYSFDLDEPLALRTYNSVVGAYKKIFDDIKVPYLIAEADSGEIGGSLSHEFHISHNSGEDVVFTCNSCNHTSNQEKTIAYPEEPKAEQNVSVTYFQSADKQTVICCYYPTSRTLEPNFIKNEIEDIDLDETNQEKIITSFEANESMNKKVVRIMDSRLNSRSNFPDFPFNFTNRSFITTLTDISIVLAEKGEICGKCEIGTLKEENAIEIGHTFYLGDKYSKPFNCDVKTENGDKVHLKMGCFGIGLSRIIATIAEINRDRSGLRWPKILSPWQFTIIESNESEKYTTFYDLLQNSNLKDEYRVDNRSQVRLGGKIKDSNMIGIPLVIILGKKYPLIEIEIRGKRYSNELAWKRLYESDPWEVEYNDKGEDIKHFVPESKIVEVVNSLLEDM